MKSWAKALGEVLVLAIVGVVCVVIAGVFCAKLMLRTMRRIVMALASFKPPPPW